MRFTLSISLLWLAVSLSAQTPKSLKNNDLFEVTDHLYLTLKKDETTENHHVIRRVKNNRVIVINKSVIYGGYFADNSGINHDWKWSAFASELQEGYYYIRTAKSLSTTNGISEVWFDADRSLSLVSTTPEKLRKHILPLSIVTSVQPANRRPHTESLQRSHNLGINGIRKTHRNHPELMGRSLTISVKEDAFDTSDLDLAGRASLDELTSTRVVGHATNMATLIGGAANTGKAGEGVARSIRFLSENFENLLPASDQAFLNRNITLQNHSYGVGIENFYGVESVAFDQQALTLPTLLHVFSSGNLGTSNSTGDYEAIEKYRTLTGSFKQAKNVLVVTGSDDMANIPDAHSAGPAYDGRIKPELTAFGGGGTSDAAALVSGACLVLQERFQQLHDGFASIDLLKAILIASSKEIGTPGPDFISGYGQMALPLSLDLMDAGNFLQDSLTIDNPAKNSSITIPEGTQELKVVLSWVDPPANDGDFYALIHDLDIRISHNGSTWEPWVLDHRPEAALLASRAVTGNDTLNNIEMITIPTPEAGDYMMSVSSSNLSSEQAFSVAYYMTKANNFEWNYPTKFDAFTTGEEQFLYFDNSFQESGTLEIHSLSGPWQSIGTLFPGDEIFSFVPEISGEVTIRALIEGHEFLSDTFAIHPKLELVVDLLCDEEMTLSWNDVGAVTYQISQFDGQQLTPITEVHGQDTLIDRSIHTNNQLTVTPVFNHVSGLQDETLNVTQQGAGCYLNNFLVSLNEQGGVQLSINLSSPENITSLNIIRSDRQGATVLLEVVPDQESYVIVDANPTPGRTLYQVQLTTNSGLNIFSEEIEIFTTDDTQYILFPNPVSDGQLTLLSPATDAIFQVIDSQARIVSNYLISAEAETFPVGDLEGVYYYRVIKDGAVVKTGRFVVQQ